MPVSRAAQPDAVDPVAHQPSILPRADVLAIDHTAGKYEILQAATAVGQPSDQAVPRLLGKLELHRLRSLLLNDRRTAPGCSVDDELADPHLHKVAAPELAVDGEVKQR